MKQIVLLTSILIVVLFACKNNNITDKKAIIKANQLGYYPNSVKKAIIARTTDSTFQIKNIIGKVVFEGKLSKPVFYDKSGEDLRIADFSELNQPGSYLLTVQDAVEDFRFEIKDKLYSDAFTSVLKSYYYQRTGIDIEEKYAGKWNRKAGHPDTLCYFHPSSMRGNGSMSSPKGWYDAGDYNKYIVNAGVTVGTILHFHEMYPGFVNDGMLNIPESGNGLSDLLDEIRFELDWVLTMQTADGASNHKLTSKNFNGFEMPDQDTSARFVVGKSTAATLNLAGMTAQAARIYKESDADFASKCLLAAEKAWKWAVKNPAVFFKNPEDVHTGEYGDENISEEFWWAASELYITTGKKEYLDYLSKNEAYVKMIVGGSWSNFIGNLGSFSLLLADSDIPEPLLFKVKQQMTKLADELLLQMDKNPYRVFLDDFQWGSNSDILNSAMIFAWAHKLTGEPKYMYAIIETTDYIFGKNATDYSFITGFGSKTPKLIHHRPSGADGIEEPVPGFVIGGPNAGRHDEGNGVNYEYKLPAKSFADVEASYASNEVCINWNAPAVFVLGYLEANTDKLK
jgi:endoglucanase